MCSVLCCGQPAGVGGVGGGGMRGWDFRGPYLCVYACLHACGCVCIELIRNDSSYAADALWNFNELCRGSDFTQPVSVILNNTDETEVFFTKTICL